MAAEVLQELDLTQRALGENLLAEHIRNFFDRDTFASLGIHSRTIDSSLSVW